jgi:sugar/nucleoside kinase (ribokinase family)
MTSGPPELLVVGHVVQDLLPDGGWRPGGAASYAALLARNLGLRTAVLTACADDFPLAEILPGIEVIRIASDHTTQMRNVYENGRRTQWLPQHATTLTAEHLPEAWRHARIVLLGPVAGEIGPSLAAAFSPRTLIGAGAQGWLRDAGPDARVRPISPHDWDAAPILSHVNALFLSDEDLPLDDAPTALAEWAMLVDILVFTRGNGGADICHRGDWRRIDAFPTAPVDLTGAGDVLAAAFLARYAGTEDPWGSARFASAAAALVIEGVGIEGVPTREAIDRRLSANPEITAR